MEFINTEKRHYLLYIRMFQIDPVFSPIDHYTETVLPEIICQLNGLRKNPVINGFIIYHKNDNIEPGHDIQCDQVLFHRR